MISPLIYKGLKFDLRVYVLVAGCNPLRVYLFKDGLVRFATEQYERVNSTNKNNKFKHLTNYAINKTHTAFKPGEMLGNAGEKEENSHDPNEERPETEGILSHKRSIEEFFGEMKEKGFNMEGVWKEIKRLSVKTLLSIQPILKHEYNVSHTDDPYNQICFEVLGLDILLDNTLKPHLLEVNHAPSFNTDTKVDQTVKQKLIKETLEILHLSRDERMRLADIRNSSMRATSTTGKKTYLSTSDYKSSCSQERMGKIDGILHHYERIYPSQSKEESIIFDSISKQADFYYRQLTGGPVLSAGPIQRKNIMSIDSSQVGTSSHNMYSDAYKITSFDHLEKIYGAKLKKKYTSIHSNKTTSTSKGDVKGKNDKSKRTIDLSNMTLINEGFLAKNLHRPERPKLEGKLEKTYTNIIRARVVTSSYASSTTKASPYSIKNMEDTKKLVYRSIGKSPAASNETYSRLPVERLNNQSSIQKKSNIFDIYHNKQSYFLTKQ